MILKFNSDLTVDPNNFVCSSGSNLKEVHSLSIKDDGSKCLKVETIDQQKIIDSYKDECSIERIIVAHGLGDTLVLDQKPGVYLDESMVKLANSDLTLDNLNSKLINLYKKTDTDLSFEDFSKAVIEGDFKKLAKKEEVNNNE